MADADLRELERRWQQSGASEDEAAFLIARVRAHDLTQQRLLLAAYLGHPAAGSAIGAHLQELTDLESWIRTRGQWDAFLGLGDWIRDWEMAAVDGSGNATLFTNLVDPHQDGWGSRSPPSPPSRIERWVHGLALWSREVCVRAGVAALRHLSPTLPADDSAVAEETVDRCDAWLACPCAQHLRSALEWFDAPGHFASSMLCEFARFQDVRHVARIVGRSADYVANALSHQAQPNDPGWDLLPAAEDEVRAAIVAELLPWALEGVTRPLDSIPSLRNALAAAEALADLEPDALRLLAHLGHPPARLAAHWQAEEDLDLEQWLRGLEPFGREATIQACVVLQEQVIEPEPRARMEEMIEHARIAAGPPTWALIDCLATARQAGLDGSAMREQVRAALLAWTTA